MYLIAPIIILIGLLIGLSPSLLLAADRKPAYSTSARCAQCHAGAYKKWESSHHGWAWRPANAANVLADFNNTRFEHRETISRFSNQDGRYYITTKGPDKQVRRYEITWTVGVTPLQQYLVALEGGRLQALDIAWDTEQKRWFHLFPEQQYDNDPGLHWTGPYKNWNARCAGCHVTGFKKQYQPKTNSYLSAWSETGVGCEACHGPGEAHVAWATHDKTAPLSAFTGVDEKGFIQAATTQTPASAIDVCAGCHARRESLSADSTPPGEPFTDHYQLALLRDGLYHDDGQIEGEVYVYGSFLQSKMYAQGVTCNHCHTPHSAKLVTDTDAVCTQCHSIAGNASFPTLAQASYTSPAHHQHPSGSEASRCVSCHMPSTTYMQVDPRRDHSFRIPRPDLSIKIGTPNACNGCHTDQSAQWSQENIQQWFPKGRHLQPHYGAVLHAGRQSLDENSVTDLIRLALNNDHPAIVRSTAIKLLQPIASPPVVGQLLPLLEAPSPLIRAAVLALFQRAPAAARAKHSGPLLADPARVVRIAAAKQVLGIPTTNLNKTDQLIVDSALKEHRSSLLATADFPETQLNFSQFALQLGNRKMAKKALKKAVFLDPKLTEAWFRLAQLEIESNQLDLAKQYLHQAIAEVPDSGTLHQLLGRILVQLNNDKGALRAFEKALKEMPTDLGVHVEYVSLLANLGQYRQALQSLAQLDQTDKTDPQVLYLMAFNHIKLDEKDKAGHFAHKLLKHHPKHSLNQHLKTLME